MTHVRYQMLEWDTDFFGLGVARIDEPILDEPELSRALAELKGKGVGLVYWPAAREVEEPIVARHNGILADRKTTFAIDLRTLDLAAYISREITEPFDRSMRTSDLLDLAVQSGKYSRFFVDRRIAVTRAVGLYHIWMERSLNKEIAEEVLVIRDGQRVAGTVTLGNRLGRGDIGLIAVSSDFRGRRYGEALVRAAQHWFLSSGYRFGQVVTQGLNAPACNLYVKCGYSIERVEYFYHFWL